MTTGKLKFSSTTEYRLTPKAMQNSSIAATVNGQAARPISIVRLHTLLRFHLQPINLVVYEGPLGRLTLRDI